MKQKSVIEVLNDKFDTVGNIKLYVEKNLVPLFKTLSNEHLTAIFDEKGFFFSSAAEAKYNLIKSEPHLYIAFTKDNIETMYIGKSFQKGGRWKRSHYYHLGTLAHHLQNSIIKGDQNHSHWIDAWMNVNSIKRVGNTNSIDLKSEVFVVFIPFEVYSERELLKLTKEEIKTINHSVEGQLISFFSSQNIRLLNVQSV